MIYLKFLTNKYFLTSIFTLLLILCLFLLKNHIQEVSYNKGYLEAKTSVEKVWNDKYNQSVLKINKENSDRLKKEELAKIEISKQKEELQLKLKKEKENFNKLLAKQNVVQCINDEVFDYLNRNR